MASATEQQINEPPQPERAASVPPAAPSRRRFILPIIGVLVLAGLAWGVQRWNYGRSHISTDNAQVEGLIVPVLSKVGGFVSTVNITDNQHVAAGALLVALDDAEFRVRLAQAEAELAGAQAAVDTRGTIGQAEAQVQTATGQRAALEAQVAAAQANQARAAADLARMRDLADKQIVSRQQLDAAQAAATAAAANLEAAQRQAGAAGASISTARAGVRLAEARLQGAQATRDNAALQLSYTKILAPTSGTVARKQVEVGQLVQPGQPLLSLVSDSAVWVTANFKETQLADLRVGQPVEIEVDAYGRCTAQGKVESFSGATGARFALLPPDNATGNFTKVVQRVPVRVAVTQGCGTDRPLRPGMSVAVHVDTKH